MAWMTQRKNVRQNLYTDFDFACHDNISFNRTLLTFDLFNNADVDTKSHSFVATTKKINKRINNGYNSSSYQFFFLSLTPSTRDMRRSMDFH